MKANELRLGNYINMNVPISEDGKLIRASVYHIGKLQKMKDAYYPVTLTEKWLLKFGFKNDNSPDYFYLELPSGFIIHYTPFSRGVSTYDDDKSQTNQLSMELIYVHQLQNLYFALTGDELQINVP